METILGQEMVTVRVSERHDPDLFYCERPGLHVLGSFRRLILPKARPTMAGTIFKIARHVIGEDMSKHDVETGLLKGHCFTESAVSALVASMVAIQLGGKDGLLPVFSGFTTAFPTRSAVVHVDWSPEMLFWQIYALERRENEVLRVGDQVFSPLA